MYFSFENKTFQMNEKNFDWFEYHYDAEEDDIVQLGTKNLSFQNYLILFPASSCIFYFYHFFHFILVTFTNFKSLPLKIRNIRILNLNILVFTAFFKFIMLVASSIAIILNVFRTKKCLRYFDKLHRLLILFTWFFFGYIYLSSTKSEINKKTFVRLGEFFRIGSDYCRFSDAFNLDCDYSKILDFIDTDPGTTKF